MPQDRESIGTRIRNLRIEKKLSQAQLGEKVGVTKGAISQWENDQIANLKATNLMALADFFHLSADEIWRGTTGKSRPALSPDIPQRRIDLIRAYGRLPDAWRKPIRMMIESLDASVDPKRMQFELERAQASESIRKTSKAREKSET